VLISKVEKDGDLRLEEEAKRLHLEVADISLMTKIFHKGTVKEGQRITCRNLHRR